MTTPIPCKTCGAMPDVVEVPGWDRGVRTSVHCPKQHDWAIDARAEKAIEVWNRSNSGLDRRGEGRRIG